ncbi:MAG: hypothetical protein AAFY72_09985 [Cyanobacteria bacterium J06649_4]
MPGLEFKVSGRRFASLMSSAAVLCLLTVSSCTVAEDSTDDASGAIAPDAETADDGQEGLRLPDIRLISRAAVPIDSLMADSADKTVAVSGEIVQKVAVLDGWLYEVQDDTGRLWVLSDRTDPGVGDMATVEGVVRYEAIVVGEIDAGEVYLEEKSYREEAR